MSQAGVSLPFSGAILGFVIAIIFAVGVFIFTLLGGVIGAPIFGKGGGAAAPPPPPPAGGPGYGGPAAGGGGYSQP
jgi:zinc transporter ZupT